MGKISDKIKMSYFTEGEKRWIKRHTEKSLKKLGKTKGVSMKPTKKRTQLFRREITMSEAAAIFNNPRVHTGKGYSTWTT